MRREIQVQLSSNTARCCIDHLPPSLPALTRYDRPTRKVQTALCSVKIDPSAVKYPPIHLAGLAFATASSSASDRGVKSPARRSTSCAHALHPRKVSEVSTGGRARRPSAVGGFLSRFPRRRTASSDPIPRSAPDLGMAGWGSKCARHDRRSCRRRTASREVSIERAPTRQVWGSRALSGSDLQPQTLSAAHERSCNDH